MIAEKQSSEVEVVISEDGKLLEIHWPGQSCRFHAIWLRDNGQDDHTRNPSNQQKLITLQDIPKDTFLQSAVIDQLNQVQLTFGPDHWQTHIDFDWLMLHRYDRAQPHEQSLLLPDKTSWDANFGHSLPSVVFDDAKNDPEVLLNWLTAIDQFGFAIMDDIPQKNAAVLDVIELFGYIRETNYGKYFEIRSEIDPINLANTALGLQSHTDNPYRNPTPGLQLFGCLQNDASGGGVNCCRWI